MRFLINKSSATNWLVNYCLAKSLIAQIYIHQRSIVSLGANMQSTSFSPPQFARVNTLISIIHKKLGQIFCHVNSLNLRDWKQLLANEILPNQWEFFSAKNINSVLPYLKKNEKKTPVLTCIHETNQIGLEQKAWTNFVLPISLDMTASPSSEATKHKNPVVYDHQPYPLNEDDYMRVCKIPKQKVSSVGFSAMHYAFWF